MKVRYPVIRNIIIDKDVRYDIDYCTGEIVGLIKEDECTNDKLLIYDDKRDAFIKVNIHECRKFEEDANP